ncbi:hypothetical protein LOTGIDRAFT_152655 [Lottia gigantea]|uniref:Uncharacterized protein n=1 Tax=Lottia gigantea TaxID=225164 RepID=V4ARU1_LOTGI|nr:hypothetical protein LOTGIDRAFT_152655 [Lottia gigantea]ESO97565.1 hypothetical protein LOTGIDRAFT_152655 [Lottia gigantea]
MGASLSFPKDEISPDRTYLVTGGNTGIGYEVAKNIALLGGHVIIACRNMPKAEAAIKQMQKEYEDDFHDKLKNEPDAINKDPRKLNLEVMEVDLASFKSTKRFIDEFKARNCKLNVLICNAGVSAQNRELTEDGFELMLQANYLSHLLIILHFVPILMASGDDSRIVQTSSLMHIFAKHNINDMNAEKSWGESKTYGNSKLYQIMFMYWMARNLKNNSVTISCCNPGLVSTQMTQNASSFFVKTYVNSFMARRPYDGATTIIKCAVDQSLKGQTGIYLSDCKMKCTSDLSMNPVIQDEVAKWSFESLKPYLPDNLSDIFDL